VYQNVQRIFALSATTGLTVTGALMGAVGVSADQVWYQSIARADVTQSCPGSILADLDDGWTQWTPSWEKWVGNGQGGYVCSRQITWAEDGDVEASSPPALYPSAGCISIASGQNVNFGGGWSLPSGNRVFSDSNCLINIGTAGQIVYAPSPFGAATLCVEAFGRDVEASGPYGDDVWACNIPT
jgi:hypothetical protein